MPFYIRQSVSVGPFRFNLSKSGVGMSVGVRGLRVGTGPRGNYVHMGAGGVYYRAALQSPRKAAAPAAVPALAPQDDRSIANSHGLTEIESAPTWSLAPASAQSLLAQIAESHARGSSAKIIAILTTVLVIGGILIHAIPVAIAAGIIGLIAFIVAAKRDEARKVVLLYDLEGAMKEQFERFCSAFDELKSAKSVWHISAKGANFDWKRNAGANALVTRSRIQPSYSTPSCIASNIDVPTLPVGKQTLYFFPDRILVIEGKVAGAVEFRDLSMDADPSNFIEDEGVPADAVTVGHTWRYVNKNGGPDRRFNNNRQIPICRYDALHMRSANGLNELINASRPGSAVRFARGAFEFVNALRQTNAAKPLQLPSPTITESREPDGFKPWQIASAAAAFGVFLLIGIGNLVPSPPKSPASASPESKAVAKVDTPAPVTSSTPAPAATPTKQASIAQPASINVVSVANEAASSAPSLYATTTLNLRSLPNVSGSIITKIEKGTTVTSLDKQGSWYRVRVGTNEGWAHGNYLSAMP